MIGFFGILGALILGGLTSFFYFFIEFYIKAILTCKDPNNPDKDFYNAFLQARLSIFRYILLGVFAYLSYRFLDGWWYAYTNFSILIYARLSTSSMAYKSIMKDHISTIKV